MPDKAISGAQGVWGYPPDDSGGRYITAMNASTLTVMKDSPVGLSTAGGAATSTGLQQFSVSSGPAPASVAVLGVLDEDVASGEIGLICVEGFHLVMVSSGALPATMDLLALSTVQGLSTATGVIAPMLKSSTAATPIGSIAAVAVSSQVSASVPSSTAVDGQKVWAYVHKM